MLEYLKIILWLRDVVTYFRNFSKTFWVIKTHHWFAKRCSYEVREHVGGGVGSKGLQHALLSREHEQTAPCIAHLPHWLRNTACLLWIVLQFFGQHGCSSPAPRPRFFVFVLSCASTSEASWLKNQLSQVPVRCARWHPQLQCLERLPLQRKTDSSLTTRKKEALLKHSHVSTSFPTNASGNSFKEASLYQLLAMLAPSTHTFSRKSSGKGSEVWDPLPAVRVTPLWAVSFSLPSSSTTCSAVCCCSSNSYAVLWFVSHPMALGAPGILSFSAMFGPPVLRHVVNEQQCPRWTWWHTRSKRPLPPHTSPRKSWLRETGVMGTHEFLNKKSIPEKNLDLETRRKGPGHTPCHPDKLGSHSEVTPHPQPHVAQMILRVEAIARTEVRHVILHLFHQIELNPLPHLTDNERSTLPVALHSTQHQLANRMRAMSRSSSHKSRNTHPD